MHNSNEYKNNLWSILPNFFKTVINLTTISAVIETLKRKKKKYEELFIQINERGKLKKRYKIK